MGSLDQGTQPGTMPAQSTAAAETQPTVLVIDDEPLMRTVMKRVLVSEGYAVITAATPAEALALTTTTARPDLILTDLVMPGMDGVELAGRLRAVWPGVPVVYMSAATEPSQVRRLAGGEGAGMLEKPFEIDALIGCVHGMLDVH